MQWAHTNRANGKAAMYVIPSGVLKAESDYHGLDRDK
jgi:hypothetical protein